VNWSRVVGNAGRTLIGAGTLILLFVVYQLWGTALQEMQAQQDLEEDFNAAVLEQRGDQATDLSLEEVVLPESLTSASVQTAAVVDLSTEASEARIRSGDLGTTQVVDLSNLPAEVLSREAGPPPPPPEEGDGIAQIRIPRIGLTKTVVEGVSTDSLRKGPGHYPGTPLPGQEGNSAIAGHRTTYGAPFNRLDELEENDLIYVTTVQGSFVYRVAEKLIVSPKDVYVLDATEDNRLTLTTCHPIYSARQRLIIVAELLGDPVAADPAQLLDSGAAIAQLPEEQITLDTIAANGPVAIDPDEPALGIDPGVTAPAPIEVEVGAPTPTTVEPPAPATAATPPSTEAENLFGGVGVDARAALPAIFMAFLTAFVGIGVWLASNRWTAWQSYLVGTPIFLISLFYFFETFSRVVAFNV